MTHLKSRDRPLAETALRAKVQLLQVSSCYPSSRCRQNLSNGYWDLLLLFGRKSTRPQLPSQANYTTDVGRKVKSSSKRQVCNFLLLGLSDVFDVGGDGAAESSSVRHARATHFFTEARRATACDLTILRGTCPPEFHHTSQIFATFVSDAPLQRKRCPLDSAAPPLFPEHLRRLSR